MPPINQGHPKSENKSLKDDVVPDNESEEICDDKQPESKGGFFNFDAKITECYRKYALEVEGVAEKRSKAFSAQTKTLPFGAKAVPHHPVSRSPFIPKRNHPPNKNHSTKVK